MSNILKNGASVLSSAASTAYKNGPNLGIDRRSQEAEAAAELTKIMGNDTKHIFVHLVQNGTHDPKAVEIMKMTNSQYDTSFNGINSDPSNNIVITNVDEAKNTGDKYVSHTNFNKTLELPRPKTNIDHISQGIQSIKVPNLGIGKQFETGKQLYNDLQIPKPSDLANLDKYYIKVKSIKSIQPDEVDGINRQIQSIETMNNTVDADPKVDIANKVHRHKMYNTMINHLKLQLDNVNSTAAAATANPIVNSAAAAANPIVNSAAATAATATEIRKKKTLREIAADAKATSNADPEDTVKAAYAFNTKAEADEADEAEADKVYKAIAEATKAINDANSAIDDANSAIDEANAVADDNTLDILNVMAVNKPVSTAVSKAEAVINKVGPAIEVIQPIFVSINNKKDTFDGFDKLNENYEYVINAADNAQANFDDAAKKADLAKTAVYAKYRANRAPANKAAPPAVGVGGGGGGGGTGVGGVGGGGGGGADPKAAGTAGGGAVSNKGGFKRTKSLKKHKRTRRARKRATKRR